MSAVRDIGLWPQASRRSNGRPASCRCWARSAGNSSGRSLFGLRVALSIHLEAKTACLPGRWRGAGRRWPSRAAIRCPRRTIVAAALAHEGYASMRGTASRPQSIRSTSRRRRILPHLIIDDGGDLIALLHGSAWALWMRCAAGARRRRPARRLGSRAGRRAARPDDRGQRRALQASL